MLGVRLKPHKTDGDMSDFGDEQWASQPGMGYTPPPPPPPRPEPLAPVLLAIAPGVQQRRLTVLFRWLLAIPHYIVLIALYIAAFVVLVIGWFGALFTGRLPSFAGDFLTGVLRWWTRVIAYSMLLTDKYPPFTVDDADYPVRVAARPGRLNRLAVLFRLILMIPAYIVVTVLSYGAMTIALFVVWLIALVMGRLPVAVHGALSAVLRYQTRFYGYQIMLTSAYPDGLFGDPPPPPPPPPPAAWAEPDWSAAGAEPGVDPGPQAGAQVGAQAGGDPGAQVGGSRGLPAGWLLVLPRSAKRLLVFYIVLGAVLYGGLVAVQVINGDFSGGNAFANAAADGTLQADFQTSENALNGYASKSQACDQQLSCLTALDTSVSQDLSAFASQLSTIAVSGSRATQAMTNLESATGNAATAFAQEGSTTTSAEYNSGWPAVNQAWNALSTAYNNTRSALIRFSF
jgi:Domain of unknown function (DUF4389)